MSRVVMLQGAQAGDVRTGERVRLERNEPTSQVAGSAPATWNGQEGVKLTLHQPRRLPSGTEGTEVWEVFLLPQDPLLRVVDVEP